MKEKNLLKWGNELIGSEEDMVYIASCGPTAYAYGPNEHLFGNRINGIGVQMYVDLF